MKIDLLRSNAGEDRWTFNMARHLAQEKTKDTAVEAEHSMWTVFPRKKKILISIHLTCVRNTILFDTPINISGKNKPPSELDTKLIHNIIDGEVEQKVRSEWSDCRRLRKCASSCPTKKCRA